MLIIEGDFGKCKYSNFSEYNIVPVTFFRAFGKILCFFSNFALAKKSGK